MKKKIINGILMVALMFAATTSFVSCKDNVDDELIPVYAQLASLKGDLENRITDIQNQINSLKNLSVEIEANKKAIEELQKQLDLLNSKLDTINTQIQNLTGDIDELKKELDEVKKGLDELDGKIKDLQDQINELKAQLGQIITGIKINDTYNDVTGTWNLPGGISKMLSLAAFFGSNETGIEQFPNTDEDAIVLGEALTAAEAAAANGEYYHFDPDNFLAQVHNNAGMMFFTVNSEDPAQFDINEWTLSVQNSVGRTAPITFSDVKPSSYQIQWGIYKSTCVDTDPDKNGDPTFFQARAHIDWKNLEATKFDIEKFIDFQDIAKDFKAVYDNMKKADDNDGKFDALVNTIAKLLVNLYSGNMSGNNIDLKNPSWSAQKLVLSKEVDGVTIKKSEDDYSLAVSSVAPLSYNSFWKMEEAMGETAEDIKDDIKDDVKDTLGGKADSNRFASFIVYCGNKLIKALKNHGLTKAVAPIVLYNTTDGIKLLREGKTKKVNAGTMHINVTSLTEELLVPALAKYVALFKDGKAVQAHVYPGGVQLIDLDLSKTGDYQLVVSAVDYYGFVCNRKYNITVE